MTNYDRIKNMSVDAMAELIPNGAEPHICEFNPDTYCDGKCSKCVKQWLESEVTEE